jgi:hypothetical protein
VSGSPSLLPWPEAVAAALHRLLDADDVRAAARAVGEEIAAVPPPSQVAQQIESQATTT